MSGSGDEGRLDNARRRVERLATRVADTASPTIDSAGKTARRAGQAAGRTARRTGEATADRTQSIASSARDAVDDGIRTVTLQEFRDEVSTMLADITQVLVVLDARVRRLERHVGIVDDEPSAGEQEP